MENVDGGRKSCSRCARQLPLSAFSKRSASRDGLQTYCRECFAAWAREHRPRKLEPLPQVPEGMKWCRSCERALAVDAFAVHRGRPDGRQSYCRECGHDRYRAGRESKGALVRPKVVPEGHKFCRSCQTVKPLSDWSTSAYTTDGLRSSCRACASARARRDHLVRTYGLTEADVAAMLEAQDGLCAICRTAAAVHVDHDHATGAVRGMLCFRCNAALGQFDEDAETLVRATRYLLTAAQQRVPADVWYVGALVEFDRHRPAS